MSLCPHGYTAFWDCPICEEPMGTAPQVTTGTALEKVPPITSDPDLVAWWTGQAWTSWHITRGATTRCGLSIPTDRGSRLTRRHHPAAQVCGNCLKPC